MKKEIVYHLSFLGALVLFHLLFWGEQLGLNSLIFAMAMTGILLYLYPEARKSRRVWVMVGGSMLSAVMIVWHNSDFSKTVHILSMLVMAGMIQMPRLRFLGYGLLQTFQNLGILPRKGVDMLNALKLPIKGFRWAYLFGSIAVVPVFFEIYYFANPHFAASANHVLENFYQFFYFNVSWEYLYFLFVGILLVGMMVYQNFQAKIPQNEQEILLRERHKSSSTQEQNPLALKHFYKGSLILLFLLNALILLANLSDLKHIWLSDAKGTASEMRVLVHEGTWLLIVGVLMAAGLTLLIFRRNLNFYKENQLLKYLTYTWLAQNVFMVFSVGMRNLSYIGWYGLAYKRLGVFLFLALTLYGLYTIFVKIQTVKTGYYLWKSNAWALYMLCVLSSCLSWDEVITKYNLSVPNKSGTIGVEFLLHDISAKNLAILYQYKYVLSTHPPYFKEIELHLEDKKLKLREAKKGTSWLSWNYAEAKVLALP